jgi:hypothetical protein
MLVDTPRSKETGILPNLQAMRSGIKPRESLFLHGLKSRGFQASRTFLVSRDKDIVKPCYKHGVSTHIFR